MYIINILNLKRIFFFHAKFNDKNEIHTHRLHVTCSYISLFLARSKMTSIIQEICFPTLAFCYDLESNVTGKYMENYKEDFS